jgi:cytochrome P450
MSEPAMHVGQESAREPSPVTRHIEAQLVLATIAQRYQLRLVPGHPVEPQMLVTLRPKYGLPMTIHRRDL